MSKKNETGNKKAHCVIYGEGAGLKTRIEQALEYANYSFDESGRYDYCDPHNEDISELVNSSESSK
ncbi:hypothetical protein IKF25_03995 [Candidatus Saccharibacteria bacterium]|nr:hypothetical protein [Candidatus Saccharibacteria bacterium]